MREIMSVMRQLVKEIRRIEKYFGGFPAELVKVLEAAEKILCENR